MLPHRRIWLASFPRSGNTFLRAILFHRFALPSTSVYGPGDLGRNPELERYAGHFDADRPPPELTPDMPLLVKTHRRPPDEGAAIYIVRDGRAATVSLWEFLGQPKPLRAIVAGDTNFGTWASHVSAWRPWARPDTLLLRYEDMVEDLPAVLARLSRFLGRPIVNDAMPSRAQIAAADGRWVREPSDWRGKIGRKDLRVFDTPNGEVLAKLGYARDGAGSRTFGDALETFEIRCTATYWRLRRALRARLARRPAALAAARKLRRSLTRCPGRASGRRRGAVDASCNEDERRRTRDDVRVNRR